MLRPENVPLVPADCRMTYCFARELPKAKFAFTVPARDAVPVTLAKVDVVRLR